MSASWEEMVEEVGGLALFVASETGLDGGDKFGKGGGGTGMAECGGIGAGGTPAVRRGICDAHRPASGRAGRPRSDGESATLIAWHRGGRDARGPTGNPQGLDLDCGRAKASAVAGLCEAGVGGRVMVGF